MKLKVVRKLEKPANRFELQSLWQKLIQYLLSSTNAHWEIISNKCTINYKMRIFHKNRIKKKEITEQNCIYCMPDLERKISVIDFNNYKFPYTFEEHWFLLQDGLMLNYDLISLGSTRVVWKFTLLFEHLLLLPWKKRINHFHT